MHSLPPPGENSDEMVPSTVSLLSQVFAFLTIFTIRRLSHLPDLLILRYSDMQQQAHMHVAA
eukprot:6486071-Amphidinium_carterae.1